MILKMNRYTMPFVAGGILTICLEACEAKKENILYDLERVVGQHIQLSNDSVFRDGLTKILVLVEDTGNCSPCTMGINEWYTYYLDLEHHGLCSDIIYVLRDSIHLPLSVDTLLEQYGLYKYYGYDELTKQNSFLQECGYSTFLVSSDNSVLLVGSPLDEPKLWNVYRETLGKLVEKTD